MLQFHDVRDAAAAFLEEHLNASNCLGTMLLSDAHQCKRLYELSWRMCLLHYETVKLHSPPSCLPLTSAVSSDVSRVNSEVSLLSTLLPPRP